MDHEKLKLRTKQFTLRTIRLVESLPSDETARILGRQLLRAGTSVGANYRAACRSKSLANFVSKMGTVEQEADECGYWMELLAEAGKIKAGKTSALLQEARELTAIAVSSINTGRKSKSASNFATLRTPRTPHSALESAGLFGRFRFSWVQDE